MIGRRQAIKTLGIGALAAPAAARDIASNAISGVNMGYGVIGGAQAPIATQGGLSMWERARLALTDKDTLDAVRSTLFEQNKIITHLDADLATKRSFSLAAKIAYQRERNVQDELRRLTFDDWHGGPWNIIEKFLGARSR